MSGTIPPLLQYTVMAWCPFKEQGQLYLTFYLCCLRLEVVTPCSDMEAYQRLERPFCLHLQGEYRGECTDVCLSSWSHCRAQRRIIIPFTCCLQFISLSGCLILFGSLFYSCHRDKGWYSGLSHRCSSVIIVRPSHSNCRTRQVNRFHVLISCV